MTVPPKTTLDQHYIYPETEVEITVLIERLNKLAGRVMNVEEWRSTLSAARRLLPQKNGVVVSPAELDLFQYRSSSQGRILDAVLNAFSACETYKNNRRLSLNSWVSFSRDYYALVTYLRPPLPLKFASEMVEVARRLGSDEMMLAASVIARNEPIVVRQLVSKAEIDAWNMSLIKRLEDCCERGEELERLARLEELEHEDYTNWFGDCEDVIDIAASFYGAFEYAAPNLLEDLRTLINDIEQPPDPEDREDESGTERGDAGREYWTIERLFEDL